MVFSVALAAWFGVVGYGCFAGVSYLMGMSMTGQDWTAIALMAAVGVIGGIAAVFHERTHARP